MVKKIGIIGVGLIGGALGMALKRKGWYVVGFGRNKERLKLAKKLKAVDEYSTDYKDLSNIEIVVIATPVEIIPLIFKKVVKFLPPEAIVTDTGSVKEKIMEKIKNINLDKNIFFIGSHPIAGSEKSTIKYAKSDLFQNCICVLTPFSNTPKNIIEKVKKIWKDVNAKPIILSPQEHDRFISLSSHLPHIISASLCNINKGNKLIGPSFRDLTRISVSEPKVWSKICFLNQKNLEGAIEKFIFWLRKFKDNLSKTKKIENFFTQAKKIKNSLPKLP